MKVKTLKDEEEKKNQMMEKGLLDSDLDIPESNVQALNQTLAIAHYNLGVEYEFEGDFEKAKQSYEEARGLALISVNTEHL